MSSGSVSGGAKDNTPLIRRSGGINSRSSSSSSLYVGGLTQPSAKLSLAPRAYFASLPTSHIPRLRRGFSMDFRYIADVDIMQTVPSTATKCANT